MSFLAASVRTLQCASYALLVLLEVGAGRFLAVVLTSLVKSAQLSLQKFHLCISLPLVGRTNDGVVISDGRCWD